MANSSRMYALTRLASRIARQPHSKDYLDFLRSPQWRQIRLAHIEGCDGICQICGYRKAVQVHHWHYRMRFGQERPEDLCAVCVDCHHNLHAILVPDAANDNVQLVLDLEDEEVA